MNYLNYLNHLNFSAYAYRSRAAAESGSPAVWCERGDLNPHVS